jgi:hypothetical protein
MLMRMSTGSPDAEIRRYRNHLSNSLCTLGYGFFTVYFLAEFGRNLSRGEPVVAWLAVPFALIFVIPAVRYPGHGVAVTPTDFVIRNIFRTHTVPRSEVERFELTRYWRFWTLIGVAVLKDGRRIPMTGVQFALAIKFAQNTVAALNANLVAEGRVDTADPPDGLTTSPT